MQTSSKLTWREDLVVVRGHEWLNAVLIALSDLASMGHVHDRGETENFRLNKAKQKHLYFSSSLGSLAFYYPQDSSANSEGS